MGGGPGEKLSRKRGNANKGPAQPDKKSSWHFIRYNKSSFEGKRMRARQQKEKLLQAMRLVV